MAASPASLSVALFPMTPESPGQYIQVFFCIWLSLMCGVQSACKMLPLTFSRVDRESVINKMLLKVWCFTYDRARVMAFDSVCILDRMRLVASDSSATTTPSTCAVKAYSDLLPRTTDPSVKTTASLA